MSQHNQGASLSQGAQYRHHLFSLSISIKMIFEKSRKKEKEQLYISQFMKKKKSSLSRFKEHVKGQLPSTTARIKNQLNKLMLFIWKKKKKNPRN